jgi:hypothetical protein
MWCAIAMSALGILYVAPHDRAGWPFTVAVCFLWLPPALSLAQWDDAAGHQPPWFYRFAALTLLSSGVVAAYGFVFL